MIGVGPASVSLKDLLEEIGAPVLGSGTSRDLPRLMSERDPALVVVDASSSMTELHVSEATLAATPGGRRPLLFAVVTGRALEAFGYPRVLDDFVVWPCRGAELELRIALARWRRIGLTGEGVLHSGELSLDVRRHRVVVQGREVVLTLREYELLRALVEARGEVLTRDRLLASVWGEGYLGGARTVDIHMRRLRSKIPEIEGRLITVRGVGYRLATHDEA